MNQPGCSPQFTRRRFLQRSSGAALAGVWGLPLGPAVVAASKATPSKVRDRFWAWAHDAHCYDNSYGLPRNGRITPVEGAHYLGVPNVIFVRYAGKPAPPFEQYAVPFKSLKQVYWSIAGAGGATSEEERKAVLQLAASQPNLTGVFMDDFFQIEATAGKPHWLAGNDASFPVQLTVTFPEAVQPTELELVQSEWPTGDYRSKDFAVEVSANGSDWQEATRGQLPNAPGAVLVVRLPGTAIQALRVKILSTHDARGAMSCGLRRLRLRTATAEIPLAPARASASSVFPGHEAQNVLGNQPPASGEAPAALSVEQVRTIRQQLANVKGRRLDLGVTLYTYQLEPRIRSHLELCDVVSLWTWNFEDLRALADNFEKLRALAPGKRILLGCYMWGFGSGKPIPLDLMRHQCELGLQWLKQGKIEGMIFLATNICDLGLEAVEWTRQWIAQVGDQSL